MRHDDPAIMMILCRNALGIRELKGYQMYNRSRKNNIQVNLSNDTKFRKLKAELPCV
jgi:hypothetical protein